MLLPSQAFHIQFHIHPRFSALVNLSRFRIHPLAFYNLTTLPCAISSIHRMVQISITATKIGHGVQKNVDALMVC